MKSKARRVTKSKRKTKKENEKEDEDDLWKFEASYKLGIDKPPKKN